MRVKMLIATTDTVYGGLISDHISGHHADTMDVSVCSALECLQETVSKRRFDVALIDKVLIENLDTSSIQLPLLLWSENETDSNASVELEKIFKHQRISKIVATVLERYAKVSGNSSSFGSGKANITAVWSPAGGVGKTTVALAYAASKVTEEKEVFYLNLETFSSVPGYFNVGGKSISSVFEMLDTNSGNVKMLVQGTSCCENGIKYLCCPDNYDDMCILSNENIKELVTSCAELTDELVIDLSCICDRRTRQVFDIADKVLLVTDSAVSSGVKLKQFISQNNVYESIKEKTTLVANKGAIISEPTIEAMKSLPLIESNNTVEIYKVLSERSFK